MIINIEKYDVEPNATLSWHVGKHPAGAGVARLVGKEITSVQNSIRDSVSIFTKVRFAKPKKRKLVNNFLKTTFGKSAAKQALRSFRYRPVEAAPALG